jgi:hypothetical protein
MPLDTIVFGNRPSAGKRYGPIDWSAHRTEPCFCSAKGGLIHAEHTHRARIPVGAADADWRRELEEKRIRAEFSHATWAAKQIARHVETFSLTGRWMGTEVAGHYVDRRDALDTLDAAGHFSRVFAGYAVAESFLEYCGAKVRELVGAKLAPKIAASFPEVISR